MAKVKKTYKLTLNPREWELILTALANIDPQQLGETSREEAQELGYNLNHDAKG
jgi:hypothetical protein